MSTVLSNSSHRSDRSDRSILCLVCSDKSFGNNFGAITCESCKAFFRRTAHEREKLSCPFKNNCDITVLTRKHCRKCRIEKCFRIGMIKEWIQTEEQLKIRRAILKERKQRKQVEARETGADGRSEYQQPTTSNDKSKSTWCQTKHGHGDDYGNVCSTGSPCRRLVDSCKKSVAQFFNNISNKDFFAALIRDEQSSSQSKPMNRNFSNDSSDSSIICEHSETVPVSNLSTIRRSVIAFAGNTDSQQSWASGDSNNSSSSTVPIVQSTDIIPDSAINLHQNTSAVEIYDKEKLLKPVSSGSPETMELPSSSTSKELCSETNLTVFHHILCAYFTPFNMSSEINNSLILNSKEKARLDELSVAYDILSESLPDILWSEDISTLTANLYDLKVRQLMAMTKRIKSYTELPLEDQITLLKESYANLIAMKGLLSIDTEQEHWIVKGVIIPLTLARTWNTEYCTRFVEFAKIFKEEWKKAVHIKQLIIIIMLFNYNSRGLKAPEKVKLEYFTYVYLLRRYLESICSSFCQARETLCHILKAIEDFQDFNQNVVWFSKVNKVQQLQSKVEK